MYLKIQKLNSQIIKKAEDFFSEDFLCELQKKSTYKESLVARYLIEQNNNKYTSISHKDDLVFVATSDENIGIDIEILKERDENVINIFNSNEYNIFGEKNWENFYILWTAKESIIKLKDLKLDDMKNIVLISKNNIDIKISGINFFYSLVYDYNGKSINILTGKKNNFIYSVTSDK